MSAGGLATVRVRGTSSLRRRRDPGARRLVHRQRNSTRPLPTGLGRRADERAPSALRVAAGCRCKPAVGSTRRRPANCVPSHPRLRRGAWRIGPARNTPTLRMRRFAGIRSTLPCQRTSTAGSATGWCRERKHRLRLTPAPTSVRGNPRVRAGCPRGPWCPAQGLRRCSRFRRSHWLSLQDYPSPCLPATPPRRSRAHRRRSR